MDDENSLSSEEWELPDPEENFTHLSLKRMASFSDEEDSVLSAPKLPRLDDSLVNNRSARNPPKFPNCTVS